MTNWWSDLKESEQARWAEHMERVEREHGQPRRGLSPLGLVVVITIGVFLGLLLWTSVAQADHGEPVADPLVAESLQVAADYWGAVVPCAHAAWAQPTSNASAAAEQPGCRIWLNPASFGVEHRVRSIWCQTIVHEYGHLLGHTHANHEPEIMGTPSIPGLVPACVRLDHVKGRPFAPLRLSRRFEAKRAGSGPGPRWYRRLCRASGRGRLGW